MRVMSGTEEAIQIGASGLQGRLHRLPLPARHHITTLDDVITVWNALVKTTDRAVGGLRYFGSALTLSMALRAKQIAVLPAALYSGTPMPA